jgi:hypothetical protein
VTSSPQKPGSSLAGSRRVSFGIKTAPQYEARYPDIARVWREADEIPEFEHARLVREVIEPVRAAMRV